MSYAIASKLQKIPTSPHLGYIQPHILEDGNKSRFSQPDDFPNRNSIFVSGGYEAIDKDYEKDDLFRIPYSLSDNYDPSSLNSCNYVSHANDVMKLKKTEYFHVFDKELDTNDSLISVPYKPRRLIFIKSSTRLLYGPFDYDEPELDPSSNTYKIKIKALQHLLPNDSMQDWSIYKLSESEFERRALQDQNILLANLERIASLSPEVVDYISDDQLLKWGNDLLQTLERLPKKELRTYQELIQALPASDTDFVSHRRERLLRLVDRTNFWLSQRSSLLNDYLQTNSGIEQIRTYLALNQERIVSEAKERFEKEYSELEKPLRAKIVELEQQKKQFEIENDQTREQVKKRQQEELTQEVQNIQQKLDVSNKDLDEVCKRIEVAKNIEALRQEEDHYKKSTKVLEKDVSILQETKRQLVHEISTSHDKLREELRKLKPYVDLLNGVIPDEKSYEKDNITIIKHRDDKPSAIELTQEIVANLKSHGRDYQFEDVANFIVCVQQNFLTVFAGLPGVGKTSLATYLARSFGLEDQKRFLTISTARGWTSQRDILGFYNPLTHKYQASPTGLYQILKACHQECQTTALSQFPYWILLDEANLSPIEHYWSAFLGMCDDYYEREIHTGDPEIAGKLVIPQSIRFIATVNYDNTTEPLSPRVIDRVPVVLLKPAEKQSYFDESGPTLSFEGILSNADLETILYPKHSIDESLTNDESRILAEILTVLQVVDPNKYSMPIIISPRKQRAIGKYCSAARDLMKGKYDLRAFDYAVAQHILPLINGNGERYLNRLKELLVTIRQLDYSRETLKHIIAVGESEQNFYRFFC